MSNAVVVGVLARLVGHVLEVVRIARVDAVHAPDDGKTAGGRLIWRKPDDRHVRPLARRTEVVEPEVV